MAGHPIDVHVGRRLKLRRKLLGRSQEQVAEVLGLTYQQVQKYESGANRISASRLFELAQALDAPVSWFFDGLPGTPLAGGVLAAGAPLSPEPGDRDFLDDRRGALEVVRAWRRIEDPAIRAQVRALIQTLAGRGEAGA